MNEQFLNVFSPELEASLAKLDADTPALWGRMDAQQMIEHLTLVLRVSIGKVPMTIHTPEEKLAKSKSFLMSEKPMPREFRASFIPLDPQPKRNPDMESAKQ